MDNKVKLKVAYDIVGTPSGMDASNIVKIFENHHTVFWDSSKGGVKPRIYGVDGEIPPFIVDTEGKELDLEHYSKVFKDQEFWARELYNCKNSPIYFFSNYGTTVWPHNDEQMSAYLTTIGVEKVVAKDDEEAKVLWDAQKERVKESMASLTIEFLKERKAVIDVLKNSYEIRVKDLEEKVKDFVRLYDSNNQPMEPRKRIANLAEKIRKVLPVNPKFSEKYRTPKGKWDTPMLYMTNYENLLEMFYEVREDSIQKQTSKVGATTGNA